MNKNSLMIVVALSLICIGAVILAAAFHTEPGLLGACFKSDGTIERYEDAPRACPELKWDPSDFPIGVATVVGDPSLVKSAIDSINARLGFIAFRMTQEATARIRVSIGVAPTDAAQKRFQVSGGGATTHINAVGGLLATIFIVNVPLDEDRHVALVHELLHAIGLAHDPFEESIMFPKGGERITDHDRELLAGLYSR
jgi:hypothetical protein